VHVFFERPLELFKRKGKMVVIAHHYLIALVQPAHYFQRFRSSSICLHFFLEIVYKENVEGLLLVLKEKSPDQSALETIAVLAFVSLVLGLFFKLHILHYIALFLLFIGIFLRGLSVRIANIWLKFSAVLGGISTRIVLLVIFFVFLTPIAYLYRMFHGDFISLKRHGAVGATYWNERCHEYGPKDLENPW